MAAKGSVLKQEISKKILDAFPGSFLYNDGKEIRINGVEDGVQLQVKCVLTCAKTPVDNIVISADISQTEDNGIIQTVNVDMNPPVTGEKIPQEPTAEEKERLTTLLNKLGL